MADHARSTHPAVQAQLDRLWALSPGADVLGLERITRLLARLGDPHHRLPPMFHVAGTNGKGSTCAYLRAALEAAGYRVHAYTSPHLVRFNERIRLAGTLIDDPALAALLAEVLDVADGIGASFFEITTAAAFLAFARTSADACVVEVGLGGRLDATNVLPRAAVCGIAALGIDHQAFLGDTLAQIAAEKAGIAGAGVPLVTMAYPAGIAAVVAQVAHDAGTTPLAAGAAWRYRIEPDAALHYEDAEGALRLPLPTMAGAHQAANLALATAMLRHQRALRVPVDAIRAAAHRARWPARLQRLSAGPLTRPLGETPVWLDGGHNASAGEAIAAALPAPDDRERPLVLILGMLANKDAAGFLSPLASRIGLLVSLPVAGHEHHSAATLAATARSLGIERTHAASTIVEAIAYVGGLKPAAVLIAGSLYLAGEVLAANDEAPD